MSIVGTVSRLIQLSPRIAVGFGDCLRKPALLLGGRKLGNEVDPVVNKLVVLGPDRKPGMVAKGEVSGIDIGQSDSAAASVQHMSAPCIPAPGKIGGWPELAAGAPPSSP